MKSAAKLLLSLLCIPSGIVLAQPVPKTVLVEHFTNSYCSICGGRNPGFYQNLSQFPQVLHIAYYPSAPYPACPFNQYNKAEADARTNFYGVYGSTPRLVVQGAPISANADYSKAAIFQGELGQTTSFALSLRLSPLDAGNAEARLVITKVSSSPLDSALVYAAVVEDTVLYSSRNGEQVHYDVFRRAVWGTQPFPVRLPATTGDSIVLTQSFQTDGAWPQNRMYGVGLLQQSSGGIIQATRSDKLASAAPTRISNTSLTGSAPYPNPAKDVIFIQDVAANATAVVYDMYGRQILYLRPDVASAFDVRALPPGSYVLLLANRRFHFVKQ